MQCRANNTLNQRASRSTSAGLETHKASSSTLELPGPFTNGVFNKAIRPPCPSSFLQHTTYNIELHISTLATRRTLLHHIAQTTSSPTAYNSLQLLPVFTTSALQNSNNSPRPHFDIIETEIEMSSPSTAGPQKGVSVDPGEIRRMNEDSEARIRSNGYRQTHESSAPSSGRGGRHGRREASLGSGFEAIATSAAANSSSGRSQNTTRRSKSIKTFQTKRDVY